MIPVAWDEVAGARRSARSSRRGGAAVPTITGIKADSRLVGPGDLFVALNTGVALRRRGSGARRRDARPRRPGGRARGARLARPLEERRPASSPSSARPARRRRRTSSARSAAPPCRRSGRRRARTTRSACRSRSAGSSRTPRCSSPRWACAGSARSPTLCEVARPARRARHLDRARAPRARRHRRARGRGERRGDRRAARRAGSPSCRRMPRARAVPRPRRHRDRALRPRRGRGQQTTSGGSRSPGASSALTLPFTAAPHGGEHPRGARRLRGARPSARASAGGRRRDQALAAGAGRSWRSRAAASSSTTPTTRTRPRCAPRCSTSSSGRATDAGSRSSARWPSSASTPGATTSEIGALARRARDRARGRGRRGRAAVPPGAGLARPEVDSRTSTAFDGVAGSARAGRRDPRQGVARRRARRHPGIDRETGRGMVRVLIAGLVAMVLAIVIGPDVHRVAAPRAASGQQIREEGPARHIVKQGTPTMGGLLILATALAAVPRPLASTRCPGSDSCSSRSAAPRSASSTTT